MYEDFLFKKRNFLLDHTFFHLNFPKSACMAAPTLAGQKVR